MKALTWHGSGDIRCEEVDDPIIQDERDAIIKVTSCAICGSDLHLYGGFVPGMHAGDVMGHETMGEVVEVGRGNSKLKVGDRVVVPFTISCGECRSVQVGPVLALRAIEPQWRGTGQAGRLSDGRPVWLFRALRPFPRRPGAISARALCRRWPDQGAGRPDRTSRCSSCRTSFRRATWRRRTATSSRVRPWPCSAAARSVCSPSSPPSCSVQNASSRSTPFLNALRWRSSPAPRRWTIPTRIFSSESSR
jgi:hypothetical protein